MKIWQKHIFSKLLKTFFFFLICLFVIFVIVDLSAHGIRFFSKVGYAEIFLYYLNTFSANLELFLSLVFLLSALRVLFELTSHRESVALQMAGISKKKLLAPFFFFASILAVLCVINCQWFAPHAGDFSDGFKTAYKAKKKPHEKKLYTVSLDDETEIVYHRFDKEKKELIDVFWVRSPIDIWHMKSLQLDGLEGRFVDHLTRNSSRLFEKTESFQTRCFKELPWNDETILNKFIPYDRRPLSTLFMQAFSRPADERIIFSHLYYKLLEPLLPFIILIGISPIVLRYTRSRPAFLITAIAIFAFLGFKSVIDGMLILGENQVLPSYIAIFSPVVILLSATMPSFARLR
ncbi:MAG: LptF/LptG family permease [Parachlamydiales bacterium]|nr:LptF/LptG family permease [Parachlamydiales bacterium]